MKEKNGKITIIVMGLIIVALLCFSGYLLYDKLNNNFNEPVNDNEDNSYFLNIYETKDSSDYTITNNSIKIEVENKNAKFITGEYRHNMILYYDNGIKLYQNGKIKNVNIEYADDMNYHILNDEFLVYFSYEGTKLRSGIYNIDDNSTLFKNEYASYEIDYGDEDSFELGYIIGYKNKDNGKYSSNVINVNTGKVIHSRDDADPGCNPAVLEVVYDEYFDDDVVLFTVYITNDCGDGGVRDNYSIYNKDGKIIATLKDNEYYYVNMVNRKVVIYNDDKIIDYSY